MQEENARIGAIEGTLAWPLKEQLTERRRIVLILHGLGGHRDYCYQKLLGQELPLRLGLWTYRFDFRNCGNSDPVPDPINVGRTVGGTDCEDLDAAVDYFLEKGFEIEAVVGHSRGNMTMLVWALRNPEKSRNIGSFINCSGRFVSMEHYTHALHQHGSQILWDGGYTLVARRYGKYEPQWIPNYESQDYAYHDTQCVRDLPQECDVLTIFGTRDEVVPMKDAALWANLFSGRHTLAMVQNADHNFYGLVPGQPKKVTYSPEVVNLITDFLRPDAQKRRFVQRFSTVENIYRWPEVEGVANFRDLGGYAGVHGSIKARVLFRSSYLCDITADGIEKLNELGVEYVFDFRSPEESLRAPTPQLSRGMKVISAPVSPKSFSPEALVERYKDVGETPGFLRAYEAILKSGGRAFNRVFTQLRDSPGKGILVHCAAGKDRTGVFCALVLSLMGVPKQIVSREYELTTIGLQQLRDSLLAKHRTNGRQLTPAEVNHILSSRYESMMVVLDYIDNVYGSAAGYCETQCGLSKADIELIRANLSGHQHKKLEASL